MSDICVSCNKTKIEFCLTCIHKQINALKIRSKIEQTHANLEVEKFKIYTKEHKNKLVYMELFNKRKMLVQLNLTATTKKEKASSLQKEALEKLKGLQLTKELFTKNLLLIREQTKQKINHAELLRDKIITKTIETNKSTRKISFFQKRKSAIMFGLIERLYKSQRSKSELPKLRLVFRTIYILSNVLRIKLDFALENEKYIKSTLQSFSCEYKSFNFYTDDIDKQIFLESAVFYNVCCLLSSTNYSKTNSKNTLIQNLRILFKQLDNRFSDYYNNRKFRSKLEFVKFNEIYKLVNKKHNRLEYRSDFRINKSRSSLKEITDANNSWDVVMPPTPSEIEEWEQ